MDPQVGAMGVNPDSQEKETPVTTKPPEICSAPPPKLFLCEQCPKGYCHQRNLTFHMQVHSTDNPHVCPLCNKAWMDSYKLTRHMRSHTGERLFKCSADDCGKVFARRDTLQFHMQTQHREEMKHRPNDHCAKNFKTNKYLKSHIRTVRKYRRNRNHVCPLCGLKWSAPSDLAIHLKTHTGEKPFKCTTCPKAYSTKPKLRAHCKAHTGEKGEECQFCGLRFAWKASLNRHIRTHTGEKPFKCTKCPKAYSTKPKLRDHCKAHTGEKGEECQFCGLRFAWKASLNRHIRTHTGETPYRCDKCGMAFREWSFLKKHRLAIHQEEQPEENQETSTHMQGDAQDPLHIPSENKQGLNNNCSVKLDVQVAPTDFNSESQESETHVAFHPPEMGAASEARPFQCTHCPKTYRLQKYLNLHLKIHNPDNLHVCPLCDKVCPDSSKLTRHMRSHTGEKLFKCSAVGCGKEFVHRYILESHIRTHTEPKPTCDICGTSFSHIKSLKSHIFKFHNPQAKQHACVTCGKVFPVSTDLKRHLETHLPDEPQECPICGKSCRNGLALKEHVQRHGNFNCEHCAKNFATKRILATHIGTVHEAQEDTRNKTTPAPSVGGSLSHLVN